MSDSVEKQNPAQGDALSPNEKIAPTVEEAPAEFADSKLKIDDEVGALASQALASGDLDQEESRSVLRKIDLYILPLLFVTYGWSCCFPVWRKNAELQQVFNSWVRDGIEISEFFVL